MKGADLESEAQQLHPIIQECHADFLLGRLPAHDLVGIYILLFLALRRPKGFCGGRLNTLISDGLACGAKEMNSTSISAYSKVLEVLNGGYIAKVMKASDVAQVTVMDIFNSQRFVGIKSNGDNHVNQCMVGWALGLRPVRLLTYIPTPSQVLRMQAQGERVVTIFTSLEELGRQHTSKLTYMEDMREHSRDALEFTVHDLKHMEHFLCSDTFHEQVGFFKCLLSLSKGRPKDFFLRRGHDLRLWHELEYVAADMNCYSTHLLRYLFAKVHASCLRNTAAIADALCLPADGRLPEEVHAIVWRELLVALGMSEDNETQDGHSIVSDGSIEGMKDGGAFAACMRLIDVSSHRLSALPSSDWECIRNYFRSKESA